MKDHDIVELAAFIDAIPMKFREEVIVAALMSPWEHPSGESWLIQSLRYRLECCVLCQSGSEDYVGGSRLADGVEVREIVSMIASNSARGNIDLLCRQMVAKIANHVSPAAKANEP